MSPRFMGGPISTPVWSSLRSTTAGFRFRGPDNELLLTRILHAGDSYQVPDRPGLVMVTGNAGGLEVKVDDAVAPALGPLGVVMRNIALDPDRLLSGTATGG